MDRFDSNPSSNFPNSADQTIEIFRTIYRIVALSCIIFVLGCFVLTCIIFMFNPGLALAMFSLLVVISGVVTSLLG